MSSNKPEITPKDIINDSAVTSLETGRQTATMDDIVKYEREQAAKKAAAAKAEGKPELGGALGGGF
ncbi:hypothetical protein Q8F55_001416 [Vanrija albida]|uniref:SMP domain-containing protein n=1 Tax=Vanrija albida TaxID=181172 RepID=A0ABR3QFY6_9TREE